MSGVYIKMEMPTSCDDCRMSNGIYCYAALDNEYISTDTPKVRPSNCPLIPVPEHGRLIDADALRESIRESIDECHKWANEVSDGEMYARVSQALGTFVECSLRIRAAPTIIEAEGGAEE